MIEPTRPEFSAELDRVALELADLAAEIPRDLRSAASSLADGDPAAALEVRQHHAELDERADGLTKVCHRLLLLQQPVAGDLRLVVAALRIATEIDRSARLLAHVAGILASRTGSGLPTPLMKTIDDLVEQAATLYGLAVTAFRSRDLQLASDIEETHRHVLEARDRYRQALVTHFDGVSVDVELVIDLGLLGRYVDRIGDHAVTLGRQTVFLLGERRGSGKGADDDGTG